MKKHRIKCMLRERVSHDIFHIVLGFFYYIIESEFYRSIYVRKYEFTKTASRMKEYKKGFRDLLYSCALVFVVHVRTNCINNRKKDMKDNGKVPRITLAYVIEEVYNLP